ncbi:hypothetical protein WJX74_004027 [Apatococcus lobatus]|uniref:non-specific serine/threonine protein kinase n=1 Tax=Apatococcus lobatus TaxID=904363 RepID=A0AAW1RVJ0_9CHLO
MVELPGTESLVMPASGTARMTKALRKEAEREHQSRLSAAEAIKVQEASAPAPVALAPDLPSLKRPRDAIASLAEDQDSKRSRPDIQLDPSSTNSLQGSPVAHAAANGSDPLQAASELPQLVTDIPEADGVAEPRSHRKHRHKHHRREHDASGKPVGASHQEEKRRSSSHKESRDKERSRRHRSKPADIAEPSLAEPQTALDASAQHLPHSAEAAKPSAPATANIAQHPEQVVPPSAEAHAAQRAAAAALPDAMPPSRSPHRASSRDPSRPRRHRGESREPSHDHRHRADSRGPSHSHMEDSRRRDGPAGERAARDRSRDSHLPPRRDRYRDGRGGGAPRGSDGDRFRRPERRDEADRGMQRMGRDIRNGRDRGRDRDERGRPVGRSDRSSRRNESSGSRERRRQQEEEDAARLEESMKEMMEDEMDEDQLIERRRKERQAIMAKHQQADSVAAPTATAMAAAAAGATPPAITPPVSPTPNPSSVPSPLWSVSPQKPGMSADDSHQQGEGDDWEVVTRQMDDRADSPLVPSSEDGDAAATELDIWQKAHQAGEAEAESKAQEEEELEMGEGRGREEAEAAQRYQQEHQKEDAAAELDMFAEDVVATPPVGPVGSGPTAVVKGLTDNYDDPEGYYLFQVGEMMDGRYEVFASHGKGVFSTVLRARDKSKRLDDGSFQEVAIKMIRSNDTMFAAGQTEKRILNKLGGLDPTSKFHCIRLLRTFEYRSHLCLVFESLDINLRELTKKYGAGVGLNLDGVCVYAKQMLVSLHHLKNCGVLHADIKPDNILVNKKRNIVKLCDFGSAMLSGDNELTPYLVSRFYRAPEVILGLKYDHPMDIWSVGCVIYELFTSKILFPGKSNNEMLRCFMDLKGPFPKKMVKRGAFHEKHFESDPNMSFSLEEEDPIDHRRTRRIIANPTKKRDFAALLSGAEGEKRRVALLADLLERMMHLDPDKRMTPKEALRHPFIKGIQTKK